MKHLAVFLSGLAFGLGICLSGMSNPAKVLNFFDVAGSFDPSLIFVMAGALLVTGPGYLLLNRHMSRPLYESAFRIPSRQGLDLKLVAGATIFGVGWGIAGFCPGGAIPVAGLLHDHTLVFLATMIAGIMLTRRLSPKTLR